MQVMPPVGRGLARTMGYPFWDPVLLFEPDVNLELGMAHLGQLQQRYRTPARVLAAYNAGVTRVTRWDDRQGADDPMIFIERIPYAETRDYVRIVTRNMDFYRALYDWTPPPPP
jgi:soluble lytic murein transglycosylase